MWLVVKKGKEFKENLIINENQIKTITELKLRVTSIEETKGGSSGTNKYGSRWSSKTYKLFYNLREICEIELVDGEKVVCWIEGRLEKLDDVIKTWDFTKNKKIYIFNVEMDFLKGEGLEDKLSKEELEKISSILKNQQEEIDKKNKELDEKKSE